MNSISSKCQQRAKSMVFMIVMFNVFKHTFILNWGYIRMYVCLHVCSPAYLIYPNILLYEWSCLLSVKVPGSNCSLYCICELLRRACFGLETICLFLNFIYFKFHTSTIFLKILVNNRIIDTSCVYPECVLIPIFIWNILFYSDIFV